MTRRMANRIITCELCANPSAHMPLGVSEVFGPMIQSNRWPEIYFHEMCGKRFVDDLHTDYGVDRNQRIARYFIMSAIIDDEEEKVNAEFEGQRSESSAGPTLDLADHFRKGELWRSAG